MDVVSIWLWIQIHASDLLLILTSTVTIASVIVRLTPTQKDDAFLAKIMPWLEKIALNKK
jgi:hypothetical protein